jgi:hypothetical protein
VAEKVSFFGEIINFNNMKKILLIIFVLSFTICFSQNLYKPYKLSQIQLMSINEGLDYVQKYADSLNAFKCYGCKIIPDFFYDFDFDKKMVIG